MLDKNDADTITHSGIAVWSAADHPCHDKAALLALLRGNLHRLNRQIGQQGALLLRGYDVLRSHDDFQDVLAAMDQPLMDYLGGTSPRSVVSGKIMTSTEVPGTYSIPLHQEMSYTDGAPRRIAFFCEVPPDADGETTIGDMRTITRQIPLAIRQRFVDRGGVQLYRNLPDRANVASKPGVPKPWEEVFGTSDRGEVEKTIAARGWRSRWNDDQSLSLWQEVRPATCIHPETGAEVWYNQIHIFTPTTAIQWARDDGRDEVADRMEAALLAAPDRVDTVLYGDGTPIPPEDVAEVYTVIAAHALPFDWQRGDLLILDNTLMAHGRRAFHGARRILTALIK